MKPPRPNTYRDTWCGTPRGEDEGNTPRVAGWVHRRRDHGGVIFIDLRDRTGLLQLVFHPDTAPEAHAAAHRLRAEHVLSATGRLVRRTPENVNPAMPTGEVELEVAEFEVLAEAETPPFPIDEDRELDELVRLKHRPLDLRRDGSRDAVLMRHVVNRALRDHLNEREFTEVETPIVTRSTPEGARDFLVPSRFQPGSFYALPQSPQLFKELLMIAGFERYYQIARCFRDEDARADRHLEFSQLDLEMSFVDEDDVIEVAEGMMAAVFEAAGLEVPDPPWPRLSYDHAMTRYGIDRPDRRFGLEIEDVTEVFTGTEFKVFAKVLADGGVIRGFNAGARELARSELDGLTEMAQNLGAGGLIWAYVQDDGTWRAPIAKVLTPEEVRGVTERLGGKPGDLLMVVADRPETAARVLSGLRSELASRFELIPAGAHDIHWVVDFPAFEWNEPEKRWDPLHHPFTAPLGDLDGDPGQLRSRAYDLVLDGSEIGGGSIRINDPQVQLKVLDLLGISEQEARERFGFLLEAMRYGAPPLGGIAMGLDRIIAICAGRDNIRDVIAFPKTATGADPLTGAPAPVDEEQLRELGLAVRVPKPPQP